jgi:HEAT repeat protein
VLAQTLADKDAYVRTSSANVLGEMKAAAKPAVAALAKTLGDENGEVQSAAAAALAQIGEDAKSAVSALKEAAKTVRGETRLNVGWALWKIDEHTWAPQIVAQTLDQSHPGAVRLASASGLAKIGKKADRAVPALTEALTDKMPEVRAAAALALAELGTKAKSATDSLSDVLDEAVGHERLNAAWALWNVAEDATVVPHLIELLEDPDDQIRAGAAGALAQIGPPAKAAVPALTIALHDQQADVRAAAAAALGLIGKPAKETVSLLALRLADADKTVRLQSGAALSRIEGKPPAAGPLIQTAFQQSSREVKQRAVQAYVGLDPEKKPDITVKQMIAALKWGDKTNRGTAALLLGAWDNLDDKAKAELRRRRLYEEDKYVFWCARLASDIQGPRVDERVRTALNQRDVIYKINEYGNFRAVFNLEGGRDQLAIINSDTYMYRHLEIRNVWATGFRFENELPANVATRLLKDNSTLKWGAWSISGNSAHFEAKVAADADGEALWSALLHVTSVADKVEKEVTGKDRF